MRVSEKHTTKASFLEATFSYLKKDVSTSYKQPLHVYMYKFAKR